MQSALDRFIHPPTPETAATVATVATVGQGGRHASPVATVATVATLEAESRRVSPLSAAHSPPLNPSRTRAIAGNSPGARPKSTAPPPLTPADREAIQEAIDERAGILEFDAGLSRPAAEAQAAEAMRVYRYRLTDRPGWLILIAPGCDLAEARRALVETFGSARLVDLAPHPDPTETAPC